MQSRLSVLCAHRLQRLLATPKPFLARLLGIGAENGFVCCGRRLHAVTLELEAAIDVLWPQRHRDAVNTCGAIQDSVVRKLAGEVKRGRERVIPIEQAEESDSLNCIIREEFGRALRLVGDPVLEGSGEEGAEMHRGLSQDFWERVFLREPSSCGKLGKHHGPVVAKVSVYQLVLFQAGTMGLLKSVVYNSHNVSKVVCSVVDQNCITTVNGPA